MTRLYAPRSFGFHETPVPMAVAFPPIVFARKPQPAPVRLAPTMVKPAAVAAPPPPPASGVVWPARIPRTPLRTLWFDRLVGLEPGLDLETLSERFGAPYRTVQRWVDLFGYRFADRRCRGGSNEKWEHVDWRLSNTQIARRLGLSRERVRQIRFARGLPPSVGAAAPG